jgi:hypothetical protein
MGFARTVALAVLAAVGSVPSAGRDASVAREAPPLLPDASRIVAIAREGAAARLRDPGCLRVLTDFRDSGGRTLLENLEQLGPGADEYLLQLPLRDGSEHPLCSLDRSQLLATPGQPRILVCRPYLRTVFHDRELAEVLVIHELLHTLGLGEDPPSSQEITRQVRRRCSS